MSSVFREQKFGTLTALMLALLCPSCCHMGVNKWPSIKEVAISHHFAASQEDDQCRQTVYSAAGRPLYGLDARLCWRYFDDERSYSFSGALDCRFYPLDDPTFPTLLFNSVHATRDWETYGRFTYSELAALAGADASRRLVQRCWVRGMLVEIAVFNVAKGKTPLSSPVADDSQGEGIVSLDMHFTVKNYPSAEGYIAAHDAVHQ